MLGKVRIIINAWKTCNQPKKFVQGNRPNKNWTQVPNPDLAPNHLFPHHTDEQWHGGRGGKIRLILGNGNWANMVDKCVAASKYLLSLGITILKKRALRDRLQ